MPRPVGNPGHITHVTAVRAVSNMSQLFCPAGRMEWNLSTYSYPADFDLNFVMFVEEPEMLCGLYNSISVEDSAPRPLANNLG